MDKATVYINCGIPLFRGTPAALYSGGTTCLTLLVYYACSSNIANNATDYGDP